MVFSDKGGKSFLEGGIGNFQQKKSAKKTSLKKMDKAQSKQEKAIDTDIERAYNKIYGGGQKAVLQALLAVHQRYPRSYKPLYEIGLVQMSQMDFPGAEHTMTEALKRAPLEPEIMLQLSTVQVVLGRTDEAVQNIDNLLQLKKEARILVTAANLHRMMGDKNRAIDYLKEALEIDPNHVHATVVLSDMSRLTTEDELFKKLKKFADKKNKISKEHQIMVQFSLAKILFAQKDYKAAFSHYYRGNQIKAKYFPFSESMIENSAEEAGAIFERFTKENLKDWSAHSKNQNKKPVPIFIVGMPRSGTTLTEQIISTHPDVVSAGETNEFIKSGDMDGMTDDSFTGRMDTVLNPDNFNKTGETYLEKLKAIYPDAKIITDKMPFNYMWAGLITLALPQAKIVMMKRNPMDNGLSIYRQNFNAPTPWYTNLKGIGMAYNVYAQYLDHWQDVLGDKIFILDYDKMVVSPKEEIKKLVDYLGFEWSDDFLKFHKSDSRVTTASIDQVRKEINTGSLGLWEHLKEELEPLYEEVKHLMPADE